jgi:hypothetical protein
MTIAICALIGIGVGLGLCAVSAWLKCLGQGGMIRRRAGRTEIR